MGEVVPIPPPAPRIRGTLLDGITNFFSKLGTPFDRNTRSTYYAPVLGQAQIEAAYRSSWLTRKVHDLVPFEMTRAGRDWQAEKDQIEKLEAAEQALGLWLKLRQALTVARLHGGSALVFGVRQGSPEIPLVVDRLGVDSLRWAVVVSRHQLFAPYGFETDPESDYFGAPAMWEMRGARGNRVKVHPSRVVTFHGAPLPPGSVMLSQLDAFWGDPLLISIKAAIDNAETSQAAVATLLHELKQDVISIPGLTEQIATNGAEEALAARVQAIEQFKSMFGALLLDGGDDEGKGAEKWETRQLSFTQHPELLRQFIAIVAGAADIPVTRLMGESPGGLQSTGKGEQDDLNRMIAARQSADLAPALARIDEILIRSVLGSRPAEIYSTFAPLEEPDPKEAAAIEYQEAQAVKIYTDTNLIPVDALAKAVANRMVESGRWPGLDTAIDESEQDPGEAKMEAAEAASMLPAAANENTVKTMAERGQVTRDMAMVLLADARPRSLYVSRKLLNAAEFIAWAKSQGFETTTPADDLHVTVVFSREPLDWLKVGEGWGSSDDKGNLVVAPGGARIVEPLGDKGAVVLLFNSSVLAWRNREIIEAGARSDFPDYQPHVTITYKAPPGLDLSKIEPYRGKLEFGPEIFEEVVDDWEKRIVEA
jgi:hypothetical protein